MREILFRGKRVNNGEWVYGYYVKANSHYHLHGIHADYIITLATSNGGYLTPTIKYAIDPATIGQYTGMTGRDYKKLFEGDIVQYHCCPNGNICEPEIIIFGESGWQTKSIKLAVADELNLMVARGYEVIGNIFDNPELLK